ncbi:helix-turn-helix transcriptional regulator [Vibrio coralliilyticus]|uniref:Helix-turn-helix transcriptional regulator n=1 Tax=Vibrio coralliilyticus TaxID=190893 RepID=A0AAP6ZUL9_9VIBR|nr:helix-turn-helix domain-containing protein [Vibrio coralliilyticus]NOJ25723.1 helix-turn-helix transcriptional regulator [Vibrio coralliilyticus]
MKIMLKDVLKERREYLGLKQSDVAEYVGVTPQTYMKWENGKNEPKASYLRKLAEKLNVSEVELCRGARFYQEDNPLSFMKKVSQYADFIDEVTFSFALFEFIQDKSAFLNHLDEELSKLQNFKIGDIKYMPNEDLYSAAMYKRAIDSGMTGPKMKEEKGK